MKEPIINLVRAGLTINMYRIRHLFYILHINQPECWIAMNQTPDAWFDNKSTLNLGVENLKPSAKVGSHEVSWDLWGSDMRLLYQIGLLFSLLRSVQELISFALSVPYCLVSRVTNDDIAYTWPGHPGQDAGTLFGTDFCFNFLLCSSLIFYSIKYIPLEMYYHICSCFGFSYKSQQPKNA